MFISILVIIFFIVLIKVLGTNRAFFIYFVYNYIDLGYLFVGPVTTETVVLGIFVIDYLNSHIRNNREKYIFTYCSVLYIVSYIMSTAMSDNPHWPMTFVSLFNILIPPYLMFYYIQKKEDLVFLISGIKYFVFFLFVYSILELLIGTSPIVNFINTHNGTGYNLDTTFRYGIKRIQGTFTHATSFGYFTTVILSFLVLYLQPTIRKFNISKIEYALLFTSLVIITLLTGTRSAIVPLFIILIYNWYVMPHKTIHIITAIVLLVTIILYDNGIIKFVNDVYASIIDTDTNSVGSSKSMRETQWEIAKEYMMSNFWLGYGFGTTFEVVTVNRSDMFGAESIWFPTMIDRGFIGCMSYLTIYIESLICLGKKFIRTFIFLSMLLFMNSATSTPSVIESFLLCMVVIIYKYQKFTEKC